MSFPSDLAKLRLCTPAFWNTEWAGTDLSIICHALTLKFAKPCNVIPDCILLLVVSLSRGGIVSIATVNHNT